MIFDKNGLALYGVQSPWEVFFLKNSSYKFAIIHRKTHVLESILPSDLQLYWKSPSTSVLLRMLRNFHEHLFYGTPPGDCFWQTAKWILLELLLRQMSSGSKKEKRHDMFNSLIFYWLDKHNFCWSLQKGINVGYKSCALTATNTCLIF